MFQVFQEYYMRKYLLYDNSVIIFQINSIFYNEVGEVKIHFFKNIFTLKKKKINMRASYKIPSFSSIPQI